MSRNDQVIAIFENPEVERVTRALLPFKEGDLVVIIAAGDYQGKHAILNYRIIPNISRVGWWHTTLIAGSVAPVFKDWVNFFETDFWHAEDS